MTHTSGARGPKAPAKKVLSVWCGGFAATPNRQHENLGGAAPIRINFRAVALKTHFVVLDCASFAGTIEHDKDILWGPEAPNPPPGGVT